MGNCSLKGAVDETNPIRVSTDAGRIIDFNGPKLAREITNDFPGYGICRRGQASTPLPEDERLVNGGFYHLLPLDEFQKNGDKRGVEKVEAARVDPTKMSSVDFVENVSSLSAMEVLSSEKYGVWKVKLVIGSQQLEDILSQQVNTEALIEKMRMAAEADSGVATPRRSKWFWFWF
ncbi:RNA polymerase II transcriptional coactivator KELP-like [Hibiscus syriacus]|uniref:RNA polymerase II transcriptional coactivator KELP-like n=1 Tax=Hibiscus syriacus TaxID=106335 RepID=A0A6A3C4G4_HIBSY|nr:uncharacterized protein LOC120206581 [Hibiscus syriacus]KAE8722488.1 RNA polymerase II transcriptional coactivator KELP-like [Hibiscus syriacus]